MDKQIIGSRNSRPIPKQFEKLLELISAPGVLDPKGGGQVTYNHRTKTEFWKKVASEVNSVPGGVYKNPIKWCKMWCDWKHKTKCKARQLRNITNETKPTFSIYELQLLQLLKIPIDALESDDGLEPMNEQFNFEVFDLVESDNEKKSADMEREFKTELNSCDDDNNSEEEAEQEPQRIEVKKIKRRKLTSPTNSRQQSEINNLERHKLRQKDEELRLRAIELNLKHQELKLKETEMTKVNSLVNIEEEKLRCFQDIASMLKELVDRTKNGHTSRSTNII